MNFSISSSESETEEWKEVANNQLIEEGLETLCAFLNSNGGKIFFGIDKNGLKKGLDDNLDKVQTKIYDLARNNLKPSAHNFFDIKTDEDNIICVFVRQNLKEIYTYRGKIFKRTGASTHCLTFAEAEQLKKQRNKFINEISPGIFTRKTNGETWECPICGYIQISGNSSIINIGGEPPNPECPKCGLPMQSNLL